jgi:hypothetical protein
MDADSRSDVSGIPGSCQWDGSRPTSSRRFFSDCRLITPYAQKIGRSTGVSTRRSLRSACTCQSKRTCAPCRVGVSVHVPRPRRSPSTSDIRHPTSDIRHPTSDIRDDGTRWI